MNAPKKQIVGENSVRGNTGSFYNIQPQTRIGSTGRGVSDLTLKDRKNNTDVGIQDGTMLLSTREDQKE